MAQSACGPSFGMRPSRVGGTSTAAIRWRIPLPEQRVGWRRGCENVGSIRRGERPRKGRTLQDHGAVQLPTMPDEPEGHPRPELARTNPHSKIVLSGCTYVGRQGPRPGKCVPAHGRQRGTQNGDGGCLSGSGAERRRRDSCGIAGTFRGTGTAGLRLGMPCMARMILILREGSRSGTERWGPVSGRMPKALTVYRVEKDRPLLDIRLWRPKGRTGPPEPPERRSSTPDTSRRKRRRGLLPQKRLRRRDGCCGTSVPPPRA